MGDQRFLLDPTAAAPEGWALANGDSRIWYQSGHAQDRKLLPSLTDAVEKGLVKTGEQ